MGPATNDFRMTYRRLATALLTAATVCACGSRAGATGVPIGGFLPMVGISLTDKFKDENDPTFTFFQADYEPTLSGIQLGSGGTPHYDLALLDTGANGSLLTAASDAAFNVEGAGFRGTKTQTIGGATGFLPVTVNDPMAMFATGLSNRTGTAPLTFNASSFIGQSSVSFATMPPESDLPNVLGLPFSSQYATYIRNDQPQIFSTGGKTVRSPQIAFLPLGSGGQGIVRRAPITLDDASSFSSPPQYVPDYSNILAEPPIPLTDDPTAFTVRISSSLTASAAYFLSVNASNKGQSLTNASFFFDTGADVTVVSQLNAVRLGFDPVLDTPDFTVSVVGSGGENQNVPGFFADNFTVQAVGGSITLSHVPIVVLDVVNPSHPGNIVDGIVGMNVLAGRNLVIDPKPALGGGGVGPSLYISDPVTTQTNWSAGAASGSWSVSGNWSNASPSVLSVANVRNVAASGNQEVVLSSSATAWEVNVSGAVSKAMKLRVQSGATLTTYSGVNVESSGAVQLEGGVLDAQFVEIFGGTLTGQGTIRTGSGPIPGQVENRGGTVAPGNGVGALTVSGRFANSAGGALNIEIGGLTAGTQYDQIIVDGPAALAGALNVSLVNLGGGTFAPALGNMFSIITAASVGGTFSTLNLPVLPTGRMWFVGYGATAVQLKVTLPGDFDDNGAVNAADLAVWKAGFGTQYTGADYLAWQRFLGQSIGAAAAVPEPATAVTLLLSAAAVLLSRGLTARR
jgi:hypothetical protein